MPLLGDHARYILFALTNEAVVKVVSFDRAGRREEVAGRASEEKQVESFWRCGRRLNQKLHTPQKFRVRCHRLNSSLLFDDFEIRHRDPHLGGDALQPACHCRQAITNDIIDRARLLRQLSRQTVYTITRRSASATFKWNEHTGDKQVSPIRVCAASTVKYQRADGRVGLK